MVPQSAMQPCPARLSTSACSGHCQVGHFRHVIQAHQTPYSACSTGVLHVTRATGLFVLFAGSAHRMYLISTKELAPAGAPGGRAQEFVILGATGNGACVCPCWCCMLQPAQQPQLVLAATLKQACIPAIPA
jgi:hypothetical protein